MTLLPPRLPGWIICIVAAVSVGILLAGCASMQQHIGGWFGGATPTPTPEPTPTPQTAAAAPRVYYAGIEGLKVHGGPSASAKVIGQLSLHERVTRFKLERGYAYVESAQSATKGWVNNSQLIWRLPSGPTTTAPAGTEPEPETPGAPATEPEPEEPAAPTAEEPQAPEVPEAAEIPAEPTPMPTTVPAAAPPSPKPTLRGAAPSIFDAY